MLEATRTQSLTDFRHDPSQTLSRLRETGDVEVLVEGGERQAVVMSPEAFDAMAAEIEYVQHVRRLQQSIQEFEEGKGIDVDEAFDQMGQRLLKQFAEKEKHHD
jgi:hypothetical protein